MVQQKAVPTVSQSEQKHSASFDWFSFICSKMFDGFEAYGFAVIGMPPSARRQSCQR